MLTSYLAGLGNTVLAADADPSHHSVDLGVTPDPDAFPFLVQFKAWVGGTFSLSLDVLGVLFAILIIAWLVGRVVPSWRARFAWDTARSILWRGVAIVGALVVMSGLVVGFNLGL